MCHNGCGSFQFVAVVNGDATPLTTVATARRNKQYKGTYVLVGLSDLAVWHDFYQQESVFNVSMSKNVKSCI